MHHVPVSRCDVTRCCYNETGICRALAIQVGDSTKPACDTFNLSNEQCGLRKAGYTAEVGACKMSDCVYNQHYLCDANSIDINWKDAIAECATYKPMKP